MATTKIKKNHNNLVHERLEKGNMGGSKCYKLEHWQSVLL